MLRKESEAFTKLCPYTFKGVETDRCLGSDCMAWAKLAHGSYLRNINTPAEMHEGWRVVPYKDSDDDRTRNRCVRIAPDPEYGYCELISPNFPEKS